MMLKKLLLASLIWACLALPSWAQGRVGLQTPLTPPGWQDVLGCNASAFQAISTAGTNAIVTGVPGMTIYVCGYIFFGGGTTTAQLEYGASPSCGSGTTAITPAFPLTAGTQISDSSTFYRGLGGSTSSTTGALTPPPAGQSLCLVTGQSALGQVVVYYIQK